MLKFVFKLWTEKNSMVNNSNAIIGMERLIISIIQSAWLFKMKDLKNLPLKSKATTLKVSKIYKTEKTMNEFPAVKFDFLLEC